MPFILIIFFCLSIQSHGQKKAADLRVNQDRLEKSIFKLSEFNKDESGNTSRVAFSEGDLAGRAYVMDLMKEVGLEVSIDYAGNIIGKRAGRKSGLKPIAFGSHIDMVPEGGNYDGCVGSMAGIEVMTLLEEKGWQTTRFFCLSSP